MENNTNYPGNPSTINEEISEPNSDQVSANKEKEPVHAKSSAPARDRRSHSGPLTPGIVLSHSASERGYAPERFLLSSLFLTKSVNIYFF